MKRLWIILLLGPALIVDAQVPPGLSELLPPPLRNHYAPRAWLGLDVYKPDESIAVHLPKLPPGMGFVVRSVEKGGPAETAGLRELDVLWKLGDQMLVNEGQLAALLRLSKPGDEIMLTGFRGGKDLDVKLTLGESKTDSKPFPDSLVDGSILPQECGGPLRVRDIDVSAKLARYATEDGTAEISRIGETYKVKIVGPKEELIYEGDIASGGGLDQIPPDWKRRIYALRRGLDLALGGHLTTNRQPRPRVVPPREPKP